MKICFRCKESKPLESFPRDKKTRDKLSCYCRVCASAATRKWFRDNPIKKKLSVKPYLVHRTDTCSNCQFKAVHICQMDIDHIDGDHSNNDPSNLQTLCANCHRLKTMEERREIPDRSDYSGV